MVASCDYEALHAPHAALLRAALGAASPPGASPALDLGCGAGAKTGWLAAQAAPGATVLGLDCDRAGLQLAQTALPAASWLAADAHALPLRSGSLALIWCVAALSLFHTPVQALSEARRVLRPQGTLVVALAGERWVRPRRGLEKLARSLGSIPPLAPADGLGDELRDLLVETGFATAAVSAYLLDPPGLDLCAAWSPLADWAPLLARAASLLDPATLAPYNELVLAEPEPEPLPVLLVAQAQRS